MSDKVENDFKIVVSTTLQLMEKYAEKDIESSLVLHTMLSIILDACIVLSPDKVNFVQLISSALASSVESSTTIDKKDRENLENTYFESLNNYSKNKTDKLH